MSPKIESGIDWQPILDRLRSDAPHLPTYPGDLKTALIAHAGLTRDPKGETAYQLAIEIARLTTCCDPEIIYWFSRLVSLVEVESVTDRPSETLSTFGIADLCAN